MTHSFDALLKCYETRSFKSIYKQGDLHEYTSGPALINRSSVSLLFFGENEENTQFKKEVYAS